MIHILRELWRSIKQSEGRSEIMYSLVCNTPGRYGLLLRGMIMKRRFAFAEENLQIMEGVRFRNPHKITCGRNAALGTDMFLQAGGGIEIGNDVLFGPSVKIWTQNHRYTEKEVPIRDQGAEFRKVTIGDDCWIGANAFIMPGVKLPRGCVVAAGSVVGIKAYKEFSIIIGNPARLIGFRGS